MGSGNELLQLMSWEEPELCLVHPAVLCPDATNFQMSWDRKTESRPFLTRYKNDTDLTGDVCITLTPDISLQRLGRVLSRRKRGLFSEKKRAIFLFTWGA